MPKVNNLKSTDFFRVAVSGQTIDKREITEKDIFDMAETYNQATYNGRVWLEHFRSIFPDSDFRAYGDILAAEAKREEFDGEEVAALYVQLAVSDDLIAINRKNQKIHSSIEYVRNYRNTGKAYLCGMAVTDSPASFGTEILKFNQQEDNGKQYSEALETTFNLFADENNQEAERLDNSLNTEGIWKRFASLFQKVEEKMDKEELKVLEGVKESFSALIESNQSLSQSFKQAEESRTHLEGKLQSLSERFSVIEQNIAEIFNTPSEQHQREFNNTSGIAQTDC